FNLKFFFAVKFQYFILMADFFLFVGIPPYSTWGKSPKVFIREPFPFCIVQKELIAAFCFSGVTFNARMFGGQVANHSLAVDMKRASFVSPNNFACFGFNQANAVFWRT